jgi:hypothetical protein
MARLYAAARLHVNYFQPSFKLKEKRREGAKVIKRYHPPATPYERALAHPRLPKAIKRRLRETYRTLDPVALLAEMRRCQEELGSRIDARGVKAARRRAVQAALPVPTEVGAFARTLGATPPDTADIAGIEPRATHRKPKRRYKTRMRMPSKLDPHLVTIEGWLAAEPQITASTIVRGLAAIDPATFGDKQHSNVQKLLKRFRRRAVESVLASSVETGPEKTAAGGDDPAVELSSPSRSSPPASPARQWSSASIPTAPPG